MQLEDYFDFLSPTAIRIKGTRVGIETILTEYLKNHLFAEEIAVRYPTLTLEQVYAALTYYWRNSEVMDAYLRVRNEEYERLWEEQDRNPSPAVRRLKELAQRRDEAKRRMAVSR